MGAGDLNFILHASTAVLLLTEPSLQSLQKIVLIAYCKLGERAASAV